MRRRRPRGTFDAKSVCRFDGAVLPSVGRENRLDAITYRGSSERRSRLEYLGHMKTIALSEIDVLESHRRNESWIRRIDVASPRIAPGIERTLQATRVICHHEIRAQRELTGLRG